MKPKRLLVAVATAAMLLSTQATSQAYDPYGNGYGSSYGSEAIRRSAENSRYEDLRTQNYQQNLRLQQLEQQGRTDRRENDWQSRQLEAEQYKSGWR